MKDVSILLVCNLGASTGVMVGKMRSVAQNSKKLQNYNLKIDAYPVSDLKDYVDHYDCVLVGPQMKHKFEEVAAICDSHNKPVEIIPSDVYGMADGAKILLQGLKLIANNK